MLIRINRKIFKFFLFYISYDYNNNYSNIYQYNYASFQQQYNQSNQNLSIVQQFNSSAQSSSLIQQGTQANSVSFPNTSTTSQYNTQNQIDQTNKFNLIQGVDIYIQQRGLYNIQSFQISEFKQPIPVSQIKIPKFSKEILKDFIPIDINQYQIPQVSQSFIQESNSVLLFNQPILQNQVEVQSTNNIQTLQTQTIYKQLNLTEQELVEQQKQYLEYEKKRKLYEALKHESSDTSKQEQFDREDKQKREQEELAKREREQKEKQDKEQKEKRDREEQAKRQKEEKERKDREEKQKREQEEQAKREREQKEKQVKEEKEKRDREQQAKLQQAEKERKDREEKQKREQEEQAKREQEQKKKQDKEEKHQRQDKETLDREQLLEKNESKTTQPKKGQLIKEKVNLESQKKLIQKSENQNDDQQQQQQLLQYENHKENVNLTSLMENKLQKRQINLQKQQNDIISNQENYKMYQELAVEQFKKIISKLQNQNLSIDYQFELWITQLQKQLSLFQIHYKKPLKQHKNIKSFNSLLKEAEIGLNTSFSFEESIFKKIIYTNFHCTHCKQFQLILKLSICSYYTIFQEFKINLNQQIISISEQNQDEIQSNSFFIQNSENKSKQKQSSSEFSDIQQLFEIDNETYTQILICSLNSFILNDQIQLSVKQEFIKSLINFLQKLLQNQINEYSFKQDYQQIYGVCNILNQIGQKNLSYQNQKY